VGEGGGGFGTGGWGRFGEGRENTFIFTSNDHVAKITGIKFEPLAYL